MDSSVRRSSRAYWACQLGGWGLYSLVQLLAGVFLLQYSWTRTAAETLALNGMALLLSHQLRAHILRYSWSTLHLRRLIPRIVAASLIISIPMGLIAPFASIAALQNSEQLIPELAPHLQPHFSP